MDDYRWPGWLRALGIAAGLVTQGLFAVTVWCLFWYLYGSTDDATGTSHAGTSHARNAVLALQFAIAHSILLLPRVKRQITRWIPAAFYGCLFCAVTCLTLLVQIQLWQVCSTGLWILRGTSAFAMRIGFFISWGALFYSLSLTGLGYQTGWTPWLAWYRKRRLPSRTFAPRSLYLWLRHPVYLSFLGLIWLTPTMTWDRVVLAAVWTPYIFIGSYLKDERLAHYVGDAYRNYQVRVAGYPGFWRGPLGKRRPSLTKHAPERCPRPNPASGDSERRAA